MKPRTLVIIVATSATLSAIGLVAGRAVFSDPKAHKLSMQRDESEPDGQNGRRNQAEQRVADAPAKRGSPSAAAVTTEPEALEAAEPGVEATAAQVSGESEGEDSAEPSVTPEDILANLDVTFENEVPDKQWVATATDAINAVARPTLGVNSEIRSIECRSSLCRIETVQEDSDHYTDFVSHVKHSGVSPEGFFTKTGETPDGKLILTMYLAREGHPLPRLE